MESLILWPQEVRRMGKAISSDLRERIVRGVEAGQSRRAMAARFEVAPSTAMRVEQRYRAAGSIAPSRARPGIDESIVM
jgi:transposase